MKAMVNLDFIVASKYLVQEAIVSIPIGLIVSFFIGNVYTMPAAFAVLVPFVIGFSLFALDEKDNWEQYRLALPLSRNDVIGGRYTTCALLAVAGVLFGAVICLLTVAVASIAPTLPNAEQITQGTETIGAVASPCIGALTSLVLLSIVIPAIAKCGMTKAVRLVPLVAVFVVCLTIATLGNDEIFAALETAVNSAFSSPEGFALSLLAATAVVAAVYAASCALSCKLYRHREL